MPLTIRTWLVIALAALASCAIATVDSGTGGASTQPRVQRLGTPTGREPRLIWTPERQAVWSQMRADFDANPGAPRTLGGQYYKLIKDNAECACRYADTGLWATLMFQITGDRRYVDLAWRALESTILRNSGRTLGGNFAREYSAEYVLQYRLALSGTVQCPAGDVPGETQRDDQGRHDEFLERERAGPHG